MEQTLGSIQFEGRRLEKNRAEREQIVATALVFLQHVDKVREGVSPTVHLAVFNDLLIA